MIPQPRTPQGQDLPAGGERLVAALRDVELPSLDDEARARIRDQVMRATRSDPAR